MPLGIAAAERTAFAPDFPTIGESGLGELVASSWCMLLAPAGTSPGIVDRLSTEVGAAVCDPALARKLQDLGFVVESRSPAQTAEFLRGEVERWRSVIRSAKVVVE